MVIEDPYRAPEQKATSQAFQERFNLADPIDRLAANVIDLFIVLMPVLTLLSAPFKPGIFESVILDNDITFAYSIIFSVLVVCFGVVAYQTICIWMFGATLGKLFLGMRVVNVFGSGHPSFSSSLLRSVFWLFGFFTFGIPFSSILSNDRRRSLHDRVSETIVVSEMKRGARKPSVVESAITRGIFAGFLAFTMLVISISMFRTYTQMSADHQLVDFLETQGGLCTAVGEAYNEWPEEASDTPRLSVAMALYAAGSLDVNCLEAEVKFLFRQERNDALSYLAKSFIHADRVKLSNSYLQRVCQIDADSADCNMSKIVEYWDTEDWDKIDAQFATFPEQMPTYVRLWLIRRLIRKGDFIQSLLQIDKLPELESLRDFRIKFKTMAYWGQPKADKSNEATDIAYDSLGDSQKINLSAWLCYNQLDSSCGNIKTKSCQVLDQFYGPREDKWKNELVALSYIRRSHCTGKKDQTYATHRVSREIQKLFAAVEKIGRDNSKAVEQLWSIVNNTNFNESMRAEAARYYIEATKDFTDLSKLSIVWKLKPQSFEWQKTGRKLFEKLNQIGEFEQALLVSDRLKEFYEDDTSFVKQQVISLYNTGDHNKAWELLRSLGPGTEGGRRPASLNQFSKVSKLLNKQYGLKRK